MQIRSFLRFHRIFRADETVSWKNFVSEIYDAVIRLRGETESISTGSELIGVLTAPAISTLSCRKMKEKRKKKEMNPIRDIWQFNNSNAENKSLSLSLSSKTKPR